jgi:hypothetical protein
MQEGGIVMLVYLIVRGRLYLVVSCSPKELLVFVESRHLYHHGRVMMARLVRRQSRSLLYGGSTTRSRLFMNSINITLRTDIFASYILMIKLRGT